MILTAQVTFVQNRAKDCQAVADSGAVPTPASELVLALLNASLDTFSHAGHDFHVVPAEAQLLGHQAWDAGAQDGLSAQGGVLGSHSQGPGGKTRRLVRATDTWPRTYRAGTGAASTVKDTWRQDAADHVTKMGIRCQAVIVYCVQKPAQHSCSVEVQGA